MNKTSAEATSTQAVLPVSIGAAAWACAGTSALEQIRRTSAATACRATRTTPDRIHPSRWAGTTNGRLAGAYCPIGAPRTIAKARIKSPRLGAVVQMIEQAL